jgi:hypothetical protein
MVTPNLWKNKKCSKPPASYHLLHLNNSTPGEVLLGHPVAPFRLIQTVAPQPFPPAPHSPPSSTCCGWVSCQRPLSVKEKEASWGDPVLGDWKNIYMWHGKSPAGGNYICLHINKNIWSTSGWIFIPLLDDLSQLWGWVVWIKKLIPSKTNITAGALIQQRPKVRKTTGNVPVNSQICSN